MTRSVLHILNGERGLDTYPSVYNAMQVLAEKGWENHVFTGGAVNGFESIIASGCRFKGGYLRRAFQLAGCKENFDLVLLYEPRDVEIFQLSRLLGGRMRASRVAHHSLEIPTEILRRHGFRRMVHRILYRGYRAIDLLIIQDEARRQLLYDCFPELTGIESVLVPNAYLPDLEPVAESVAWFDEIKRVGHRVVSYTGAIERWALSLELFKSIRDMRDVSFVFSGWSYDGLAQEAMELCRNAPHVHFDLGLKSRSVLNYIVRNSDVGLVFYDSADPNVAAIGLSSGKLHKFLSYGKPVVVNDVPSIKTFLEENGFGLAGAPELIPEAIEEVLEKYGVYSERVKSRYFALVDFRSSYERFIAAVG